MLSIPILFFMGAASHLGMANPATGGAKWGALILLAVVILLVEINALVGPAAPASGGKKILATLSGTFWAGFILTAILSVVVETPREADRLRKNPLGVYVNSINWSRELG